MFGFVILFDYYLILSDLIIIQQLVCVVLVYLCECIIYGTTKRNSFIQACTAL